MAVAFTDEEFEEFYNTFEQLHSVYGDDTQVAAAIKHQLVLWRKLQEIKCRGTAASPEQHPSPVGHPIL